MYKGFTDNSWDNINNWIATDKKIYKRIKYLIEDIERNLFIGIGQPEALKHNWSGWCSRRIDQEHRVVYKVSILGSNEKELVMVSLIRSWTSQLLLDSFQLRIVFFSN